MRWQFLVFLCLKKVASLCRVMPWAFFERRRRTKLGTGLRSAYIFIYLASFFSRRLKSSWISVKNSEVKHCDGKEKFFFFLEINWFVKKTTLMFKNSFFSSKLILHFCFVSGGKMNFLFPVIGCEPCGKLTNDFQKKRTRTKCNLFFLQIKKTILLFFFLIKRLVCNCFRPEKCFS